MSNTPHQQRTSIIQAITFATMASLMALFFLHQELWFATPAMKQPSYWMISISLTVFLILFAGQFIRSRALLRNSFYWPDAQDKPMLASYQSGEEYQASPLQLADFKKRVFPYIWRYLFLIAVIIVCDFQCENLIADAILCGCGNYLSTILLHIRERWVTLIEPPEDLDF